MYLSKYFLITILFISQTLIAMEYPDNDGDKGMLPITLLTDGSEYKNPTEEESAITAALQEIQLGETPPVKKNLIKKYKRHTKKKKSAPFLTPEEKNKFLTTISAIDETCKLSIDLVNNIQGNEEKQNMLDFLHQQQNLAKQTFQETLQMEHVPLENIEQFDIKLGKSGPDELLKYLNSLADTMAEDIKNRP